MAGNGRKISINYQWSRKVRELKIVDKGQCLMTKRFRGCYNSVSFVFKVNVYPNGSDSDQVAVCLFYKTGPLDRLKLAFTTTLYCHDGSEACCKTIEFELEKNKTGNGFPHFYDCCVNSTHFGTLLKFDNVENAEVRFRFTIELSAAVFQWLDSEDQRRCTVENGERSIFENLYQSVIGDDDKSVDKFADIRLISRDKQIFRCHKVILANLAEHFFDKISKENSSSNNEGEIVLNFVDGDVLTEILHFLYRRRLGPGFTQFHRSIVEFAENYRIIDLKTSAECQLYRDLNVINVLDSFRLADEFQLTNLFEKSLAVVAENFETVSKDKKWTDFVSQYPDLISKLLSFMAERLDVCISDIP